MNKIFLIFLSLSLSGLLIALLLFLLKPLVKDRLSKTWQYYIFLIVIVRLLLPFGPDTSLMGMVFNQTEDYVVLENDPAAISDTDNIKQTLNVEVLQMQLGKSAVNTSYQTENIGRMVLEWLWLAWAIPAAWLLLRKIVGYNYFSHSVKVKSVEIENVRLWELYRKVCQEMRIKHMPGLVLNEMVAAPMLVGIVQPVIVLPDTSVTDNELRYIFQHELTHYKRMDIIYKWHVQIAVCLHWYNPFVYWISREVNRNCELSCDETVIKQLDKSEQRAYGDMLLKTIKQGKMSTQSAISITLSEDTKLIKERLGAIMKHKKQSHLVVIISALLAIILLCGANFTGVYTAAKPIPSAELENIFNESPIIIDTDTITSGGKIELGSQHLLSGTKCQVSLKWVGDSNLTVLCTSSNGVEKPYNIENGKKFTFQIDADGEYTIAIKNDNTNNISDAKGSITFEQNTSSQQPPRNENDSSQISISNLQTVIYENVEMRQYEEGGGFRAHPYIHDIRSNNTDKTIVGFERVMLAFDKNGEPLQIDWWNLDSDLDPAYSYLYKDDYMNLQPGQKDDVFGGWSLNYYGLDSAVDQIAYVLYCDKEITFEDGTIWKNPDFDKWLETYKGKTIAVEILDSYYPYEQKIEF